MKVTTLLKLGGCSILVFILFTNRLMVNAKTTTLWRHSNLRLLK